MKQRTPAPEGYLVLYRRGWHYPVQILSPGCYGFLYRPGSPTPIKQGQNATAVTTCLKHKSQEATYEVRAVEDITGFTVFLAGKQVSV